MTKKWILYIYFCCYWEADIAKRSEKLLCFSCMHQQKYLLYASWLLLCTTTEDNTYLWTSIMVYTPKSQKILVSVLKDTINTKIRIESSLVLPISTLKFNRNTEEKNTQKAILPLTVLVFVLNCDTSACHLLDELSFLHSAVRYFTFFIWCMMGSN